MIDLKCKCTKCAFNKNCNCTANEIQIGEKTTCERFLKQKKADAEYSDEISHPLIKKSVDVYCNANCLFNKDGLCVSNGITLSGNDTEPICDTFLKD